MREFSDLCSLHPEALAQLVREQGDEGGLGDETAVEGVGVPRVVEERLSVYEAQNAAGVRYKARGLPAAETKAWMALALQLESESACAVASKEAPEKLVEDCARGWVNQEEAAARGGKGGSLPAVQSLRVLGLRAAPRTTRGPWPKPSPSGCSSRIRSTRPSP